MFRNEFPKGLRQISVRLHSRELETEGFKRQLASNLIRPTRRLPSHLITVLFLEQPEHGLDIKLHLEPGDEADGIRRVVQ